MLMEFSASEEPPPVKSLSDFSLQTPVKASIRHAPFASKRPNGGGKQQWPPARSQVPLAERDLAKHRNAAERAVLILQKNPEVQRHQVPLHGWPIIQVLLRPPSKPRACTSQFRSGAGGTSGCKPMLSKGGPAAADSVKQGLRWLRTHLDFSGLPLDSPHPRHNRCTAPHSSALASPGAPLESLGAVCTLGVLCPGRSPAYSVYVPLRSNRAHAISARAKTQLRS